MTASGHGVSFGSDENVLKLMVVQLCHYSENHQIIHFKRVNFIVCELYINKVIIFKKERPLNSSKDFTHKSNRVNYFQKN